MGLSTAHPWLCLLTRPGTLILARLIPSPGSAEVKRIAEVMCRASPGKGNKSRCSWSIPASRSMAPAPGSHGAAPLPCPPDTTWRCRAMGTGERWKRNKEEENVKPQLNSVHEKPVLWAHRLGQQGKDVGCLTSSLWVTAVTGWTSTNLNLYQGLCPLATFKSPE